MSTQSNPHRVRASDAEREQVATILRAAMAEGRLNLADGEERMAAAYAATLRDELVPLTADLPGGGREALAATPEARAQVRRTLRRHGSFVAIAALVLVGLWALSPGHFFWPAIPLAFLTIGLVRHARWHRYGYPRGGWPASWQSRHHGTPPWSRT
jgi:hypothetical protein